MAGSWGMDANTWGNVIAAGTGAGASVGGAVTVFWTAALKRKATERARVADRDAELRKQSREALARVVSATNEYADVARVLRASPLEERAVRELREGDVLNLVQRVTEAAALVDEKRAPVALLRAVQALRLARVAYPEANHSEWGHMCTTRDNLMRASGELAAATLREGCERVDGKRVKHFRAIQRGREEGPAE